MSRPNGEIVMSITLELRQFLVLVRRQAPSTWVATISEHPAHGFGTQPLGAVEPTESAEEALRHAFNYIFLMVGPLGMEAG